MPYLVAARATAAVPAVYRGIQSVVGSTQFRILTTGPFAGRAAYFAGSLRAAIVRVINDPRIRAISAAFGGLSILESLAPGDQVPLVPPALGFEFGAGTAPAGGHPGQVSKQWNANGVPFVRLSDGRMGAYSAKKGTWRYWRPKKPIVMFAGGSSDLRTLLKADRAAERQLRRLKKAVDRRFPSRPRRRSSSGQPGTTIIQESGAGGVQRT